MIIPAILENSWEETEKKIKLVQPFAKWVHIDFIDEKYAQGVTPLDPSAFSNYSGNLFLEAHLMTEEPVEYLDPVFKAGFKRFIGQIEEMSDQVEFVAKGQGLGEVGLGIDLDTDLSEIKVPFDDLDLVLIMAVKAGNSGQKFNESCLTKIKDLRLKSTVSIEVDGGINKETIRLASLAGANLFTANSFLFGGNPEDRYKELESRI